MTEYRIKTDIDIFLSDKIYLLQKRKKILFIKWWYTISIENSLEDAINKYIQIKNEVR